MPLLGKMGKWSKAAAGGFDADAAAYFSAVEAVSTISTANKTAVNDFVVGCKTDGIWGAISCCVLLAGAGDLTGCLVPLKGPAPTNNGFIDSDRTVTGGVKGDASSYLNSNRSDTDDALNDNHMAVYNTTAATVNNTVMMGVVNDAVGATYGWEILSGTSSRPHALSLLSAGGTLSSIGLIGQSRSSSTAVTARADGTTSGDSITSLTAIGLDVFVFARNYNGSPTIHTNNRCAAYTIGADIDLGLLDGRLTTYVTALT